MVKETHRSSSLWPAIDKQKLDKTLEMIETIDHKHKSSNT